jgi:DNA mismatch repair protein MutS
MPAIKDTYMSKSYLRASSLRHPIIERIATDTRYVSNNIALGLPNEQDGILLYGLNSSGKSSLMKSIGIAIVMAQSGMFVPCDAMEFWPYDYIFTRILSCDDIFKGQSTFTKEMLELRGILKRSNRNSLVLGDELCSGTESISALSIVSAGIHTLAKRECSFVFATHLHDLVEIEEVQAQNNVKVYHLSVEYNPQTKRLVYDRKLKDGNGSTLYGLEVCKSLDLDTEFLQLANHVRHKLLNTHENILSTASNQNKYNRGVYVDKCQICGAKASEIHHISQQKEADENGYIGTFHKNDRFNLVCLCERCHNQVHHGYLVINGYSQTSDGVVLDHSLAPSKSTTSSSQSSQSSQSSVVTTLEEEIHKILSSSTMMKKGEIVKVLQTKFGDMSKYKIEKMLKDVMASKSTR